MSFQLRTSTFIDTDPDVEGGTGFSALNVAPPCRPLPMKAP